MKASYIMLFRVFIFFIVIVVFSLKSPDVMASKNLGHKLVDDDFDVSKIPSLVFTYWQYRSLIDAKNSRGVVRAPTPTEIDNIDDFEPDPGPRDISLGGILFTDDDSWVIWLNGKRVTPDAVPEEVLDLKVFKDYIEIKWLDDYTNQVFPVRIRTHQRFNMDARIFLPGDPL